MAINPFKESDPLKWDHTLYKKRARLNSAVPDHSVKVCAITPREALELKFLGTITELQYEALIKKWNGETIEVNFLPDS